MSKMDSLRAMREARYEQAKAQAAASGAVPTARTRPVAPPATASDAPDVTADDGLCGHRNIGGRTCTRERGHTAKSHRYS